jgi:hypothetical protein
MPLAIIVAAGQLIKAEVVPLSDHAGVDGTIPTAVVFQPEKACVVPYVVVVDF